MEDSKGLVIVHIGAGIHSEAKHEHYKKLIKRALLKTKSERVLLEVSEKLEKSPLTNTGYGSSLNLVGSVQCDASFIFHDREYRKTEMGSMYNIANKYPIGEAVRCFEQLNRLYTEGFKSFGLSRPLVFDHGQKQLLNKLTNTKEGVKVDSFISSKAQKIYDTYKVKLMGGNDPQENEVSAVRNEIQDTIGVIHITSKGTDVATSSGGNFFKFPGRIGCAGVLGAGIGYHQKGGISVSCMCSGNGEDIIAMNLANRVVDRMVSCPSTEYCETLVDIILQSSMDVSLAAVDNRNETIIYVGVVCVLHDHTSGKKHLVYCHSTESFYFGFRSHNRAPEVVLSRLDSARVGRIFARGEFKI